MRIYTRMFNALYASIPYCGQPLSVPASKKTCFAIGLPHEGYLERLVVAQATGTPVDFEVELLNSAIPFPAGIYDPGDAPADDLEHYRVHRPATAALTQTAGNVLTFIDDTYGPGYRNIDGTHTANQRLAYLLIKPISAGGITTWNVTLQIRTDVS